VRCRLGILQGQPTIVGRQPRFHRDRANTAPTPIAAHSDAILLLSRITRLGGRRDPDTSAALSRARCLVRLSEAASSLLTRRCDGAGTLWVAATSASRDPDLLTGNRSGGVPTALAMSTRTAYRQSLEGEQSAHRTSVNPNQRGHRQLLAGSAVSRATAAGARPTTWQRPRVRIGSPIGRSRQPDTAAALSA